MNRPTAVATARIALLYALFGASWIAVTDRVLEAMVADPHTLTRLQSYKGWAFVAVSAALISSLVRRELHARDRAEEALRSSARLRGERPRWCGCCSAGSRLR